MDKILKYATAHVVYEDPVYKGKELPPIPGMFHTKDEGWIEGSRYFLSDPKQIEELGCKSFRIVTMCKEEFDGLPIYIVEMDDVPKTVMPFFNGRPTDERYKTLYIHYNPEKMLNTPLFTAILLDENQKPVEGSVGSSFMLKGNESENVIIVAGPHKSYYNFGEKHVYTCITEGKEHIERPLHNSACATLHVKSLVSKEKD